MPRDDHVIFVIIVMQWASPLRDIRVHDLTIKSVLNARCLYKSLQFCSCLMSSRHLKTKSFNVERICDVTTKIYCAKKFKIEFKFESMRLLVFVYILYS